MYTEAITHAHRMYYIYYVDLFAFLFHNTGIILSLFHSLELIITRGPLHLPLPCFYMKTLNRMFGYFRTSRRQWAMNLM